MLRSFFVICVISLFGCSDNLMMKVDQRKPEIIVYPDMIDFGHLVSGYESKQKEFTITNAGNEHLNILMPELEDNTLRYSLLFDNEVNEIAPGEYVEGHITYNPATYESNEAKLKIQSDDEDEAFIEVPIIGHGDAPVITLNPEGHDFGTISIGCDNELRLTIGNEGNLPLEITSVQQMVTQPIDINMNFGTLPDFPWVIEPGFELDIITSYTPSDVGPDSSLITIDSNDPLVPTAEFEEEGMGQVEQWIADTYEQEEIPLLDILWVIDNSGSMFPFQQALADNIDDFMNVFLSATPDFHMAFITTDRHLFQGVGMIDNNSQNPELLAASTLSGIGTNGSGQERGIQYSKNSTEGLGPAAPGSLFLREEATLVIIYVSDEPDYSLGTWSSYTTHFSSLKDPDKLHIVSIVGDDPSGCLFTYGNYTRNVSYGSGYIDLTNYFNGTIYSLCSTDWGMQMEDLAETVSQKRRFELSEQDPIENTIEVYVNGQLVTEWSYDATENWIEFNLGSEPDPGDTIEIKYATWGCE